METSILNYYRSKDTFALMRGRVHACVCVRVMYFVRSIFEILLYTFI